MAISKSDPVPRHLVGGHLFLRGSRGWDPAYLRGHLETLSKLAPTLRDFDHRVTRFIGGIPFASANHYYASSTTHKRTRFSAFNAFGVRKGLRAGWLRVVLAKGRKRGGR
ncbi:uncharacterized protein EI90DRAFT_3083202 [Cantharellus anzutake]|uniref:uncharacterized protein n=1 Tax=Cantharellus anzutake TaxID=1750568 RepID=UPI001903BDF8|nr:uncharacterized protein EI90DRAFT_3083202 [Cantharellus anzutake]KAF8318612.1 hypothetical protein EI90DRAFT_3083202 [Cantharellus anzutake]